MGQLYLFVDGSFSDPAAGGGWFATDLKRMALASFRLPNGLPNSEVVEAYALEQAFGSALAAFPEARSVVLMMDNVGVLDSLTGFKTPPSRYAHKIEATISMAKARGIECDVAHVKSHQNRQEMEFVCNAVVDRLATFGRVGYAISLVEPFRPHSWARRLREVDPELTVLSRTMGPVRMAELLRYRPDEIEGAARRHGVREYEPGRYLTHSVLRLSTQMRACGHWGRDYDEHLAFRKQSASRESSSWKSRDQDRRARITRRFEAFLPAPQAAPTP